MEAQFVMFVGRQVRPTPIWPSCSGFGERDLEFGVLNATRGNVFFVELVNVSRTSNLDYQDSAKTALYFFF